MKIELEIKNMENIGEWNEDKKNKIEEIILALITCGGLTGIKGGKTQIHFNNNGEFQGITFDYWGWKKRIK